MNFAQAKARIQSLVPAGIKASVSFSIEDDSIALRLEKGTRFVDQLVPDEVLRGTDDAFRERVLEPMLHELAQNHR